MTDMYSEKETSSKKYLVPLVVLLLCGVAMTGAAYAYNSTLEGTADAPVSSFEISMGEDANVTAYTSTDNIEFKSVVTSAQTTYTVENAQTIEFKVYLLNVNNTDNVTLAVNSPAVTTPGLTGLDVDVDIGDFDDTDNSWTVTLTISGSVVVTDGNGISDELAISMTLVATPATA